MISLTTLIIAGAFTIILLLVSIFFPNPITWIMTLILGAVFYFILLPGYQGQQQAVYQGETITAAVQEVREWSRKQGDGNYIDQYEIIAVAPNPETGAMYTFVSPPMKQNPKPYLGDTVNVTVEWSNPKAYVMDLSFLPFAVH